MQAKPLSAVFGVFITTGVMAGAGSSPAPDVREIVARSVANNQADWEAAPQFSYQQHEAISKDAHTSTRTYRVFMIEGSPYEQLIARNDEPLNAADMQQEKQKLDKEIKRRKHESASERNDRIAEFEKGRQQDHALMQEMIKAFTFKLEGRENLRGHDCYRVSASPRPGYVPEHHETKVLTGMRGTLWIDAASYQWVKVTASVFRPVAFGLFVAQVQPGTEFTLEEAPVEGNIWLPVRFETRVNARVLFWSRNSLEVDTYSDYTRAGHIPPPAAAAAPGVAAVTKKPGRSTLAAH